MRAPAPAQCVEPASATKEAEVAFAAIAAREGWREATLDRFCVEYGISDAQRRLRWPEGIRTIGWRLNELADATMLSHLKRSGPLPLSEVLHRRFRDNEPLRRSVRRLACSDAFHPLDTWVRTARTADLMWQCQDEPLSASDSRLRLRRWALVILYSGCVIVWLAERPGRGKALRAAIRLTIIALGAR